MRTPCIESSFSKVLCRVVAPTWSIRSSPTSGSSASSKRLAHAASLAIKTGVALTKAHPAINACSAYHREAFTAPLGSKLTTISESVSFNASATFTSGKLLTCTTFFVYSPIPSKTGPLCTVTLVCGISTSFNVLFGDAKMASDKSFPTFRLSTSKAATI